MAALIACLTLAACTSGGGGEPSAAPPSTTVTAEIAAAPAAVSATNGGPTCTLRQRTGGGYAVVVSLANRLAVPRNRDDPVFYDVEVVADGRTFSGWVTGVRPRPIPDTSFWRVPPTPLDAPVPDSEMAPEDYLGVREVPAPLQACRISIVPPGPPERAIGGRQLQVGDDGKPVVMTADGEIT